MPQSVKSGIISERLGKQMSEIPETDQWLLSGNCEVCRRRNYCNKPCTKGKRRRKIEVRMMVAEVMVRVMTGKE